MITSHKNDLENSTLEPYNMDEHYEISLIEQIPECDSAEIDPFFQSNHYNMTETETGT